MLSRRLSAYSAVEAESKAFRLREVFGPTGVDRLGSSHAFVTREVERHADSRAVFPLYSQTRSSVPVASKLMNSLMEK